jgi:hypothetical protein
MWITQDIGENFHITYEGDDSVGCFGGVVLLVMAILAIFVALAMLYFGIVFFLCYI